MVSIEVVCPEGDPVIPVLSAATNVRIRPQSYSTIHDSGPLVVATEDCSNDGLALLRAIRERDASRPVILLTECYDSRVASEVIDAGVTDYLALGALDEPRETLCDRIDGATMDSEVRLGTPAFRTLANSVGDAILAVDTESRIVFANEGVEQLTGYARAELRGKSLLSLIPEEMHDAHRRGVVRYLETGERELDWEYIELPLSHRAGHEITVAVSFGEFRSDGSQYFTGAIRDITDRKQQQAELRETRKQLEDTLLRISDAFFAVDTDWRFTYVNEHAEEMLGRSAAELLGENVWEEFPEAMTERFYDVYHRAMETQEAVTFEEHHAPLSTWFEVSAYPSEDGLSVYFRDMTERKEREETLTSLISTNRTLMRVETAEEIAMTVVGATEAILGFDINGVHLPNDDGDLAPTAVTDYTRELIGEPPTYQQGEGIAGETFTVGEPRLYDDVRSADAFDYGPIRSAMALPLGGHGVLVVGSVTPKAFDETDIHIAELLTASARTAFDRAERTQRIETLHDATREMVSAETTERVCSRALAAAEAVLGHALAGVHLLDGDRLKSVVWTEGVEAVLGSAPPALGRESLAWDAFETSEGRLYNDLHTQDGRKNPETPIQSGLYVPIGSHGVLLVSSTEVGSFDGSDLQLVRLLAENMSVALDRVEREVELRRYETVFETVQDMLYVLDSEGCYTMMTEPLADQLGYDRKELIGRHVSQVMIPEEILSGERVIRTLLSDPDRTSETYESSIEGANGEIPIEIELSLLLVEGEFRGTVGVVRDISELERTRRELDDEQDRFTYLFETLPDPVDEIAFEERAPIVQSVNTAFERVFGYDPDSLVGSPLPEEAGDPTIDVGETKEISTKTATGTRHFLFRRVPYSLDANTHAFGIYTDITEQKERERQLRVLHRVLRHNLRNGLNVMTAAANQLIAAECAADRRQLASTLVDRADALVALSEKASMLERTIERRDGSMSIDAVSVIESVVESYCEDLDIETELPESCSVSADHRLTTVVSNLLDNVVEHSSTVDGARPSTWIALETDASTCELRIADDGPGIPELERELLSGAREITQLEHGSGLGLWLVKWTVESYGGRIDFEDESGTTVVLRLPLASE